MASAESVCWWFLVQNLNKECLSTAQQLTVFKNSLYLSDFERDRRIFHSQYCFECKGFCRDKSQVIAELRRLVRELDQILFAINDVLVQKCLPSIDFPENPPESHQSATSQL